METGNYCREDTAFGRVSYVKRKPQKDLTY